MKSKKFAALMLAVAFIALPAAPFVATAQADQPVQKQADAPSKSPAQVQEMIDKATSYLKDQQNPDGSFGDARMPPAVTALILRGLAQDEKYPYTNDITKKGYDWLVAQQKPDGGIYKDMLENYNTAISISALAVVKDQPAIKPALEKAVAYMKGTQWKADSKGPNGEAPGDPKYNAWEGGFSYNPKHGRPDLSNVHFSIQALYDAGLSPDDPAFKAAQKFLTRSQNRSESNDQPFAGNDGGFIYSPANGGDSEAEDYVGPDGKKMWRSYGTMTYAGIKSMIYAGISKDDPRVKAAIDWTRANWTFDENPGLRLNDPKQAQDGMFYLYQMMAKALHAYGQPVITDTKGVAHDWREELIAKLASLQKPDGSWVGGQRWMENMPLITTSYTVLALEEVKKDLAEHPAK